MPKRSSPGRCFGPETFQFLRELAKNNNREWFLRHKPRYESTVQGPAVRFITELGPRLGRISSHIVADPRPFGGSLTRIYRDTRFSKDKSPYRTHIGVHFSHEAAEGDRSLPGFFFRLTPGDSLVASGMWRPAPPDLVRIRDAIVASPAAWGRVVGNGIEIGGESYVRVPAGYDPEHRYAADLRRKDFFATRPFRDSEVTAPGFGATFEKACRSLNPLNGFLAKAIQVPW
ncbi:MAG: DUF2461 domain-containing protein [Thermoplasmata archaeon]|jgi:uncharacterized protein (TIGR02453 family)|nr:DUF2461 domain-containing protein [Thermoplasmata archaeon]